MSNFVVDASVAAAWFLSDETNERTHSILMRLETWRALVPTLFWFEITNTLLFGLRHSRIELAGVEDALVALRSLPIDSDSQPSDADILHLAVKHRLTAYDASYLAIAIREHIPLATLDNALAAAAKSESIALIA